MYKFKNKILVFSFIFLILLSTVCMASTVPGDNAKTADEPVVTSLDSENETTSNTETTNEVSEESTIYASDYFVAGQNFELDKLVDGNSFAMGNDVTVTGQINGDLFVMGNTVTIDENAIIYNNLFVLANEVIFNGTAYNIYALSSKLTISGAANIYRDVAAYSNEINIAGRVQRDVSITTNKLTFADDSKTLIYGSLEYSSTDEATIPDGVVQGDVKYTKIDTSISTGELVLKYIVRFVATAIFVLVVVLFLIFFAPKSIDRAKYNLVGRPFATTGIGILGIVLIPFVAILLMTLTVTMPLACVIAVIYGILVSLGFSFFAIAIAKYFVDMFKLSKKWQLALFTVISALVMYALTIIPVIGGYAQIFFTVVGFGIALVTIFSKKFEKTDKKVTDTSKETASATETPIKDKETKTTKKSEKTEQKANKKDKKSDK